MRYFVSLFFVALSLHNAYGTTYDVAVQFAPEGPQYKGLLVAELNIANWKIARNCYVTQDYQGARQDYEIPEFTLTFNQLTYKPDRTVVTLRFVNSGSGTTPNCLISDFHEAVEWFWLNETTTKYPLGSLANRANVKIDKNGSLGQHIDWWSNRSGPVIIQLLGEHH